MSMTMEQFEEVMKHLPAGADKKKVAKALGVELPVEVKPLDEQLSKTSVVKYTAKKTKKNPNPIEIEYVVVPSLKIDQSSGAKSLWVRASVARKVAQSILDICNKNNL